MIDYKYADLFNEDSTSKHMIIEYDTTVITNDDLFNQEIALDESLCSEEELTFGSCEASVLKFKVANIVSPMINKWIAVKMYLDNHVDELFALGAYKVAEDKVTADRKWRDVIAYDAMYDILNSDMVEWYNTILPRMDSTVMLRQFRTSFISYFGLEEVVPEGGLANDDMIVTKTIEITANSETDTETAQKSVIGEVISGKTVITAICEINGCFGHIGRDGKFHYIYLTQDIEGLYPSDNLHPSDDLFPKEPYSVRVGQNGSYIDCKYQDIVTHSITKLQIRQEENDIGVIYGEGDNCYIIEGNFLVYGKSSDELLVIAQNIFSKISKVTYRPLINADVKGNPCFEVGDAIRISTKDELVETYILERTLKGIQALRDTYSSNGVERYAEKVNGVHQSIKQLKGKANILTRTIEETRLEMYDIEAGLSFSIAATAKGIQAEITAEQERAKGEEIVLSNKFEATSEGLKAEIERAEGAENGLRNDYTAKIAATAKELSVEISEKTQTWDTGSYKISYEGEGEPKIPVSDGKYYLDTKSGAIYIGIVIPSQSFGGWVDAGYYELKNESSGRFERQYRNPSYTGYMPEYMTLNSLNKHYVSNDISIDALEPDDGLVWLETSSVFGDRKSGYTAIQGATIDYWVYELEEEIPGYAEWKLAGYATIMTLPEMATRIRQTSSQIELKVNKGDVTSQLLIEPTDIYLKSGRLRIETNNLEINKDGVSGEILSRDMSKTGATKETARYIKLNTGGLEGGYGGDMKCKIVCNDEGLEFRGKILTFCMNSIKVGEGMNSTSLKTAYTGDIKYAVVQTDGSVGTAVLSVRNGMIMKNV